MTDGSGGVSGYQAATEQRNVLERLMARLPGFRGFAERELRRDVDRLQREHLSQAVHGVKRRSREVAGAYADAGKIGLLDRFDRLDRRFDRLAESIRFADYGASGLFSSEKVGASELQQLYEFDLSLLDDLDDLEALVENLPPPGQADPGEALEATLDRLRQVEEKWSERETVISRVVQTAR